MPRAKTHDDRRWRKPDPEIPGVRARERRDAIGPYLVFEVRWKDPASGRKLSETLDTPQEALDFKAQLRLMRRRGVLGDLDRGRETLDAHATEWLERHAAQTLARATLAAYVVTYNRHLYPRVGHLELRHITPQVVDKLRSELLADGVGAPTVRKALMVLSSMLATAVIWGRLTVNPVREVKKPAGRRRKVIRPLTVLEIETLTRELRALEDEDGAVLVQLLAYTGARPQDALALTYEDVGARVHLAHKVVGGRRVRGAKTGEDRSRSVEALPSLRRMLLARRAATPGATAGATAATLIVGEQDGRPWQPHTYKNWTRRTARGTRRKDGERTGQAGPFARAVLAAGLDPQVTPYVLRHTYASLRIAEQRLSLQEIAAELGHSLEVLATTYAHVISEYAGQGPVDPERLIREARATLAEGTEREQAGRRKDATNEGGGA